MIEIRAFESSSSADLLTDLLVSAGVPVGTVADGATAIVSYGKPLQDIPTGMPTLNTMVGSFDKFDELTRMHQAGVRVPPFALTMDGLEFPLLGRRRKHSNGRDIAPILRDDRLAAQRRAAGTHDFFVQYVPWDREFRVWSYRRQTLAVYEKVLKFPERSAAGKRKLADAIGLEFVREADPQLQAIGNLAVAAMGLDFGAVDVLLGADGQYYALEVNTAPGAWGRRRGIEALAHKIKRWIELGYPRRRNE